MNKRLAIIGAGPIGLEAALRGVRAGFSVTVFEKGRVGENILKWAHIRLFTPLNQTFSPLLLSALDLNLDPNAFLTGREIVKNILVPGFQLEELKGTVQEQTRVISIGRKKLLKTDLPGHPTRNGKPFRLLTENSHGAEKMEEFDAVIDAGGVYGNANWSGEGGLPVPGERAANAFIHRRLPDLLGSSKKDWIGKKILLIGNGHSAATAVRWISALREENPETALFWVVSSNNNRPVLEAPSDPLPERKETTQMANDWAENPTPGSAVFRKGSLAQIESQERTVTAFIRVGKETQSVQVDRILSLTGYKADLSNLSELQIDISPVTGGAGKLAKALLGITDCLADIQIAPDQLKSGEENFFLAGHKSYGRLNTFLLQTGVKQLDQIFALLKPETSPQTKKTPGEFSLAK